ncbi:MAG TPA: hypothetical protein VGG28_04620 [Kofleriaceae bacterium]
MRSPQRLWDDRASRSCIGKLDVGREAEPGEPADHGPRQVGLVAETVARTARVLVMRVVVRLAVRDQREPRDVARSIARRVRPLAEAFPVAGRVDDPRRVVEHDVDEPQPRDSPPRAEPPRDRDLRHEARGHHEREIEQAHEPLLLEIARQRAPDRRMLAEHAEHVEHEEADVEAEPRQREEHAHDRVARAAQPTRVRVPETFGRRVRIARGIRQRVVRAMRSDPLHRRAAVLRAEQGHRVAQPRRRLERAMRQQPVIADRVGEAEQHDHWIERKSRQHALRS